LGTVRNRYQQKADAAARMTLRSDVGAVKVGESKGARSHQPHDWVEKMSHYFSGAPTPTSKASDKARDVTLSRVLERVADGSLSVDEAEKILSRLTKGNT
jgi:hypothetical protein